MNRPCVMVVEDERIIALALSNCLRDLGYCVHSDYDTAEAALASLARVHPDVVLMDIGLVGAMDGVEAAQQIRERFGVPVVFLTGDSEESTLARARTAQPAGFIIKPFDERTLEETITRAMIRKPDA